MLVEAHLRQAGRQADRFLGLASHPSAAALDIFVEHNFNIFFHLVIFSAKNACHVMLYQKNTTCDDLYDARMIAEPQQALT